MTVHLALGSATTSLSDDQLREAVRTTLAGLGTRRRVLAVPPDQTRSSSKAGVITGAVATLYGEALCDVLPALGTHAPMSEAQIRRMYPEVPLERFRVHDWRRDVVTIGELDVETVRRATEGVWEQPWPAQLNRLIWQGGHDLILSIGQVVPHEVAGMANGTKNLFIGCGGAAGINESHFIGAAYGMERMMGRADTPVRRLLDAAQARFCGHLPILYLLTVIGAEADGSLATRGLFIGEGPEAFALAAGLSLEVNFTLLEEQPALMVVQLDAEEFRHRPRLGNKGDLSARAWPSRDGGRAGGAPGPGSPGFSARMPRIDRLIRRYGYRSTPEVMRAVREHPELRANLSAAAHLIHGSSEGRFRITYCPGHLTREEIEGVGYQWGDPTAMQQQLQAGRLQPGWNHTPRGRCYYIDRPALGLWSWRGRFTSADAHRQPC